MNATRHFTRNRSALLLTAPIAVALACAMPGSVSARVEAEDARMSVDTFLCEGRAFVVVGADGSAMVSPDGAAWTPTSVTVATNWRSHCRGKDISVRVGQDGRLWTSCNDTNWTARDARVPFALHRVTHGNGRFVAVGNEGAVVASDDGLLWTPQDSGTDERLRGVAYGNGLFVAVGYAGTILVSRDGTHWKRRRPPTDVRLLDVAFGNGIFVAVGWQGWVLTSSDGLRWRRIRSGTMSHLWRVAFGGDSILEGSSPTGHGEAPCARSGAELLPEALIEHQFLAPNKFGESNTTTSLPMHDRTTPGLPA